MLSAARPGPSTVASLAREIMSSHGVWESKREWWPNGVLREEWSGREDVAPDARGGDRAKSRGLPGEPDRQTLCEQDRRNGARLADDVNGES